MGGSMNIRVRWEAEPSSGYVNVDIEDSTWKTLTKNEKEEIIQAALDDSPEQPNKILVSWK